MANYNIKNTLKKGNELKSSAMFALSQNIKKSNGPGLKEHQSSQQARSHEVLWKLNRTKTPTLLKNFTLWPQ